MKYLIFDIETNGLDPTKIWIVVTKDFQTGEVKRWYESNSRDFNSYIRPFLLVGHNCIWFDIPVLNILWKSQIDPQRCVDTLVVSRLLNSWDYNHHSLADWGKRLNGEQKVVHEDWSKLTPEMEERCESDVRLTEEIFKFELKYINDERFKKSLRIEHDAAIICTETHYNGFGFDITACQSLYERIRRELSGLSEELSKAFPPRRFVSKTIITSPTRSGSINRKDFRWITDGRTPEEHGARVGIPYYLYDTVEFNPASTKQCIERLWEFGWKPVEKTKGYIKAERERDYDKLDHYKKYGWTISEENLNTLPPDAPAAAKSLVRWILLSRRLGTLDEWRSAYNPVSKCIHGEIKSIGTWTGRASHTNPNTGNITRVTSEFGSEMRSLWRAGDGFRQIGCDAEGIQLRILAHYMQDEEFTEALVSGNSKDGTDVHTLNWRKLNGNLGNSPCKDRTTAKTFIYSYILGASPTKTAQIFGCSIGEATSSRDKFVAAFPGLRRIREELIPNDARQGYFFGIDGRPVMCDSRHLMLAGYLQNGESVIMKYANWKWREQLRKERIPFWQMNYVHDEWQTRTVDDEEVATYIGQVQANWIKQAGIDLGVKCELAGSFKTGFNWKDCH